MTKTKNNLKAMGLLLVVLLWIASLGILSLAVSAAEEDACISTAACTGTYANGICTACGGYQPAVRNSGGAYEIGNAGQLLWFAELCNSIERTTADRTGDRGDSLITYNEYDIPYDAILTADITLNENLIVNGALTEHTEGLRNWIPIGNYTSAEESYRYIYDVDVYQGTFDGRGHTIRGLYINDSEKFRCAMFSSIGEEGVVKNVIFEDTYFASMSTCSTVVYENFGKIQGCKTYGIISVSNQAASGVCSYNYGRIEHCINYAKIFGVDDAYFFGGIVRENRGDIENCANFGALGVSQNSQIGGIAGNNFGTIKKCFSNASITSTSDWNGAIVHANQNTGVISDCYYNSTIVDFNAVYYQRGTVENTEGKAAEAFASGEIAYLLGEGWGQTLGVNANPVFATENNRVYYGYVCNESLTDPIYTNSNAVTEERHEFELALAHDGSYTCAVCGWLDRSATMLLAYRQAADSKNTHLTVAYDVSNSSSFRRNSATISFRGGFLDNEITLGLFNGRTVNGNGENFSYGEKNTVGYVGADLSGDTLTFKYAFPPADEDHAAGDAVTVSYTIRYYGEDGLMRESSGSLDMEYVSYGITPQLTEYGATLDLNFYSTEGTVIKENVYNAGDYSVTLRDYYGAVLECPYRIEEPFDIGTSITKEDTEGGIVMTIERSDANSVFVSIPEGVTAITVEGNGRPRVKVTITESVKFSYKHINSNGDEMEKFISVDIPEASEQKPIMERLGYTTVDWNDEGEYALAADGVTKYRVGSVSVYLTNCIFKSTRGMVYFTFIPGGVTTYTFSKDDILLIENGVEHALTEDVTVSASAVLVNDHVFLDATCTVPQTCIYCSQTEGDALGHDMNAATCIGPSTCATCGHTEGDVDKNAHAWNEGVLTTEPTCSAVGVKTFTCTHNGEHTKTEDVAIDENAHTWNNGVVTTDPTCSTVGTKTFTCTHNSAHTKTEDVAIDENAHAWNNGVVTTDPTCSTVGTKTYTCTHNSAHTKTEDVAIDENAHTWNNGVVTTDPTCSTVGTKTYTCTHNSAHTKTEEIPALGHAYDNACDTACNICGAERTVGGHVDADGNGQCDACTVPMSSGSESTNGGNNNAAGGAGASADEGLPAGAITGIVTGSVTVAGIGGFSLFWFVIKKKKWSDLIGIFKK